MEPRASSSLSVKKSENRARSATLLNMILMSSLVMGDAAADEPEELEATEIALEDEPDEPDEDSAALFGLKGVDCPMDRKQRSRE